MTRGDRAGASPEADSAPTAAALTASALTAVDDRAGHLAIVLHRPAGPVRSAVVIVEPFGIEALGAAAALRAMTAALVGAGRAVARCALPGLGDNGEVRPGVALVDGWRAGLVAVVGAVRSALPGTRVDVIGLRVGATLAASTSLEPPARGLVLWAPVTGRSFGREFAMLGASGALASAPPAAPPPAPSFEPPAASEGRAVAASTRPEAIEAGGFWLEASAITDLRRLDAPESPVAASVVLVVDRDDMPLAAPHLERLRSLAPAVEVVRPAGFTALRLDNPEVGVVPHEAVGLICAWLDRADDVLPAVPTRPAGPARAPETAPRERSVADRQGGERGPDTATVTEVRERHVWVPVDGARLAVVVTERGDHDRDRDRPRDEMPESGAHGTGLPGAASPGLVVVFAATGSNPACGAGRLNTRLARRLAALGHVVVRYDRRGIGASLPLADGPGTSWGAGFDGSYDDRHVDDLQTVCADACVRTGASRYVVVGLCSGAYHAFHLALRHATDGGRHGVAPRAVLSINQFVFLDRSWTPTGESPATAVKAGYELRAAVRDPGRLARVVRGEVPIAPNVRRLAHLAWLSAAAATRRVRARLDRHSHADPSLPQALEQIDAAGIRQVYVFDEADSGLAQLRLECGSRLDALQRAGRVGFHEIAGAGHTFAPRWTGDWLAARLVADLDALERGSR